MGIVRHVRDRAREGERALEEGRTALQEGSETLEDESERLRSRRERLVSASRHTPDNRRRAQEETVASGKRDVAFLGKSSCDADERELLAVLGRLLYDAGTTLHLSSTANDSRNAIAAGYKAAGGVCQYHSTGLHKAASTLILHTDIELESRLDKALSGWRENGWLVIDTQEKLVRLCEAAMMFLDEA